MKRALHGYSQITQEISKTYITNSFRNSILKDSWSTNKIAVSHKQEKMMSDNLFLLKYYHYIQGHRTCQRLRNSISVSSWRKKPAKASYISSMKFPLKVYSTKHAQKNKFISYPRVTKSLASAS